MSAIRSLLVLLVFLLGSVPLLAQEGPSFKALWERHLKGESPCAELRELLDQEQAPVVERFNAGYLLAVIEIGRNQADRALELLDRLEALRKDTAQVAIRRAEALLLGDHLDEANKVMRRVPRDGGGMSKDLQARAEIVRARLEARRGEAKGALARLQKLAKKRKDDWEVVFFIGRTAELLDDPKLAIESYARAIEKLPEQDPCPGVYALQRWAALSVSSDGSSYGNRKLLEAAIARYQAFLARAEKNAVPAELVDNVRQTIGTLEYFTKGR